RSVTKDFQFFGGPGRMPKLSPRANATFSALPPSSLLSRISNGVLSSMPVSVGSCPLDTCNRKSLGAADCACSETVNSRMQGTDPRRAAMRRLGVVVDSRFIAKTAQSDEAGGLYAPKFPTS